MAVLPSNEEQADDPKNATAARTFSLLTGGRQLLHLTCSVQGERQYMEDEYFVEHNGRFAVRSAAI